MKTYIGTKTIKAKPMTRGDYNKYKGWAIPENENPADEGYLIEHSDGYRTWLLKEVFERQYRVVDEGISLGPVPFGSAIELMKKGFKVKRQGWNGKNQYIELASAISYTNPAGEVVNNEHAAIGNKAIAFVGTSGVQMGWLASQADMLAEDWVIVQEELEHGK